MEILVLHNNYPAQFKFLLPYLVKLGHKVTFLSLEAYGSKFPGVKHAVVKSTEETQPLSSKKSDTTYFLQKKISNSELFRAAFEKLSRRDFRPDLVVFHSGWGLGVHIKTVFPSAKLAAFAEWWFSWNSPEQFFDQESLYAPSLSLRNRISDRYLNFTQCFELSESDYIWTPTLWQKSQFPQSLQQRMHVIHEGVDTSFYTPPPTKCSSDLIHITYTTRAFEPMRAFEHFTFIAKLLLLDNPLIRFTIIGRDKPSYRPIPKQFSPLGVQARELFAKHSVDDRVTWHDRLPFKAYKKVLQSSDIHIYFSRPFVASWSLLEAMSCGCCIVASDIFMVREILSDSGTYVDHTNYDTSVSVIQNLIASPDQRAHNSLRARTLAKGFRYDKSLAALDRILGLH